MGLFCWSCCFKHETSPPKQTELLNRCPAYPAARLLAYWVITQKPARGFCAFFTFVCFPHTPAEYLSIVFMKNNLFSFAELKGRCLSWEKWQVSPLFPLSSLWLFAEEPQLEMPFVMPDFHLGGESSNTYSHSAREVCPRPLLVSAVFTSANATLHIWG